MTTLLITHPSFINHDTGPGHPERPDRMRAIDKVLAHDIYKDLVRVEAPLRADIEEAIRRTHPGKFFESVEKARPAHGEPPNHIDGDTVISEGSWEAGLRAVGAGLEAVDQVVAKKAANAFCQVRPPGHHAESHRAMGFCFFNNIAIAAQYVRAKHGAERVAVVDFDVHHGNGTQEIFWNDKNLFYGSTHQMPLFPGTGGRDERGEHDTIVNAPLRAGNDGEIFRETMEADRKSVV